MAVKRLFHGLAGCAFVACAGMPLAAAAEPIQLKLSFYSSDRSTSYFEGVKPFVDAINSNGKDLLSIEVYFSGALSRIQAEQPKLVLEGGADIAFVIPGQNPDRFRDNTVIELPGLFSNAQEASLVHTRLVAASALAGYQDFFVIGAYGSQPEILHSRKPLASLADLKGQKIRTNNMTEAVALSKLGALPMVIALNETSQAISSGLLDGALVPPAQLFDAGINRLVSNHYLLGTSSAPLALLMNRKVFKHLPDAATRLIRKYSGEWTASRYAELATKNNEQLVDQLKSDPRRTVVVPSPSDIERAQQVFIAVQEEFAASSPTNRTLLDLVRTHISKLHE